MFPEARKSRAKCPRPSCTRGMVRRSMPSTETAGGGYPGGRGRQSPLDVESAHINELNLERGKWCDQFSPSAHI